MSGRRYKGKTYVDQVNQVMRDPRDKTVKEASLYSAAKNSLSWKETYRAMAAEKEDWSDFDVAVADGLE